MKTDLIIPFHGQTALLVQCLKGLAVGPGIEGRVLLVDDDSPREEVVWAKREIQSLRIPVDWLSLPRRYGFVDAVNIAWRQTRQPAVVILNNDTIPTADLLPKLLRVLELSEKIAAVAPASDNPRDLFQYCKSVPQHTASHSPGASWGFSLVSYLTAMCLAVKREAIKGPLFDSIYAPGYFEDLDLCCRLRSRGWQLAMLENCRLRHIGNATFGREPRLGDLRRRNYALFSQRWSHLPEHCQLDRLLRSI